MTEQFNSLKGKLLVAAPELFDPDFSQSVILVIHHSEQGAAGLMLTRKAMDYYDINPAELASKLGFDPLEGAKDKEQKMRIGGPVGDGALFALHDQPQFSPSETVSEAAGVLQSPLSSLKDVVTDNKLVIIDYSGWGAGQLEDEIEMGGWRVIYHVLKLSSG